LNSEVGMRKWELIEVGDRNAEFGKIEGGKLGRWTRRRPKRTGLCRGKNVEVGKKE
jgi:hypothetical protein